MNFRWRMDTTFAYQNRRVLALATAGGFILHAALAATVTYPLARSTAGVKNDSIAAARRVESLEKTKARLLAVEAQIEKNQKGLNEFYTKVLAQKRERLTLFLRELRRMAAHDGIRYTSINYNLERLKSAPGVVCFETELPVEGVYDAIRKFVSAIENNDALFLTVHHMSLRSMAVDRFDQIKIDIGVSTYFLDLEEKEKTSPSETDVEDASPSSGAGTMESQGAAG